MRGWTQDLVCTHEASANRRTAKLVEQHPDREIRLRETGNGWVVWWRKTPSARA